MADHVAHGWVTRAPSDTDGRGRVIALIDAGRELIDAAFTDHLADEERLLAPISTAERTRLAALPERWTEDVGR